MTEARPATVLDWEGPLSPPRRNGELVFDALWESRVFGMTMTLYEQGVFQWDEFRDRLIAVIAEWDRTHEADDAGYHYWACWLAAFESLVAAKDLCPPAAVAARVATLAARPAGHDHRPPESEAAAHFDNANRGRHDPPPPFSDPMDDQSPDPAPALTGRQRKLLRGLAHGFEPLVHVGSAGVTAAVLEAVDAALTAHELLKVRLHQPAAKHDAADALAAGTGAALCGLVGHVVILYRPHPQKPKITLGS